MRPIQKLRPGSVITLEDGSRRIVNKKYSPYRDALEPLTANIGPYCSYCEHPIKQNSDREIEHIKLKSKYPNLKTYWGNFLLSCGTCNTKKATAVVKLYNTHLPHRNNTFLSFEYTGGVVRVNPQLTGLSKTHAENLIKLVRLDEPPSCTDNRFFLRLEQWNIATRYLQDYKNNKKNVETIIDYVKVAGYWSIWFTVFKDYDIIRARLISDFNGTDAACFDKNNHYNPISRNPTKSDPI